MNLSSQRLPDSILGKILIVCLILTAFFCITFAGGNEWYSLAFPLSGVCITSLLYAVSLALPIKHPELPRIFWFLIIPAALYGTIRALYSPGYYEAVFDISLICLGITGVLSGIYLGMGKRSSPAFLWTLGGLGLLHLAQMLFQVFTETQLAWFRPDFACEFSSLTSMGLLGYENFSANVFAGLGAFLCVYQMSTEKRWSTLFWVGLSLLIASCFCHSRAALMTSVIAIIFIFFVYCLTTYKETKKFFTAIIILILGIFSCSTWLLFEMMRGNPEIFEFFKEHSLDGRIDLSGFAWKAAADFPLFGVGSQQFRFYALEHSKNSLWGDPNFAHHEYAQMASDYGYIGLTLMLIILGWVIYKGFKTTLTLIKTRSYGATLSAAALTVLLIQMQHAYVDFIWHSPSVILMSGCCIGIILTGGNTEPTRKSKMITNLAQILIALSLTCASGVLAYQFFPIWQKNWNESESFATRKSDKGWENLKEIIQASGHTDLTFIYTTEMLSRLEQMPPDARQKTLQECERLVENAYSKSPNNILLAIPEAAVQDGLGNYDRAEEIYARFLEPNKFAVLPYGWKMKHLNHLCFWIDDLIAKKDRAKALSIMLYLREQVETVPLDPAFIPWKKQEMLNKLHLPILYLQKEQVQPDDSWKKSGYYPSTNKNS